MKKLIFFLIILFFIPNVKAIENICFNQTHYYYFYYIHSNEFECYTINNNQKIQAVCTDTTTKTSTDDLWNNIKDGINITSNTVFSKVQIPNDYNVKSVQTEALTNLTKNDYYLIFDALINQNSLTEKDDETINMTTDSYIYQEKVGNRVVYHHVYGDLKEEVITFFEGIKTYYDTLSKEEKVKYRNQLVNDLYENQIPSKATIGTLNQESFKVLTENNLNDIFDSSKQPTIQRIIEPTEKIEPIYYYNGINQRSLAYIIPTKVEVIIETDCHTRTCQDVNKEYLGCEASLTCNENLIQEYEQCNPLQEIENPKTKDLNKPLVLVILIMVLTVFTFTYQEKNNKKKG